MPFTSKREAFAVPNEDGRQVTRIRIGQRIGGLIIHTKEKRSVLLRGSIGV